MINGKSYIGQSVDIHRRWRMEVADSKNANNHSYDYPLMKAFRKYGIDNFKFEIIEECPRDKLDEREDYWQEYFKAKEFGYSIK